GQGADQQGSSRPGGRDGHPLVRGFRGLGRRARFLVTRLEFVVFLELRLRPYRLTVVDAGDSQRSLQERDEKGQAHSQMPATHARRLERGTWSPTLSLEAVAIILAGANCGVKKKPPPANITPAPGCGRSAPSSGPRHNQPRARRPPPRRDPSRPGQ